MRKMADLENARNVVEHIKKLEQKCKKCTHQRFTHLTGVCLDVVLIKKLDEKSYKGCKCKEFIPSDNLEYVEYLAKKRKLI